jgi:hypothetical protein
MAAKYTLKNLTEVKDAAPAFGYDELQEARFATKELDAERTGMSHHRVKPGKRQDSRTSTTRPRRCTS